MNTDSIHKADAPIGDKIKAVQAAFKAWISKRTPMPQRFWNKVKIGLPDQCWEFQGPRGKYGHGKFKFNWRCIPAARMAWIVTNGDPGNLFVLHTCDNGACCNIKHLYLGTAKQNGEDAANRNRHPIKRGESAANAILTNIQAESIRREYIPYVVTQKMIADKYGVSEGAISAIIKNRHFVTKPGSHSEI